MDIVDSSLPSAPECKGRNHLFPRILRGCGISEMPQWSAVDIRLRAVMYRALAELLMGWGCAKTADILQEEVNRLREPS